MDRVKGKVAIVTGGASGIGKAAAILLAAEGAGIAVTDISDESGREVVDEIKRENGSAAYWHMNVADEKLAHSPQPALVTAAAMMHFCALDYQGAKQLFSRALSMDADDYQARLMLYLIDWLANDQAQSLHRQILLDLDWRSSDEFKGYLARVLEKSIEEKTALQSWYNFSEKSWLNYIVGLLHSKRGDWAGAEKLMHEAILTADTSTWEYFLARAQLEQYQKRRRDTFKTEAQWNRFNAELKDFEKLVEEAKTAKLERREKLVALYTKIADGNTDLKEKRNVMEQTFAVIPDNRNILAALAYYSAADDDWPKSLGYIQEFLQTRVRQNARSMSIGLLEACVLKYQGKDEETQKILQNYGHRIRTPWFLDIHDYLMGKQTKKSLKEKAGETPEKLVTAYTVMGLWDEGSGKPENALKHYKEALESLLDDWLEYDLAKDRIIKLKESASAKKKS